MITGAHVYMYNGKTSIELTFVISSLLACIPGDIAMSEYEWYCLCMNATEYYDYNLL